MGRNDQSLAGINSQVIPLRRALRYPNTPELGMPARPNVEVRHGGFLGLGVNKLDLGHDRRMTELYHLGREVVYAEATGLAADLMGIKHSLDATAKMEQIVSATDPDSVTGLLADDMGSDMARRNGLRHGRLMELFDSEAMTIVRGR